MSNPRRFVYALLATLVLSAAPHYLALNPNGDQWQGHYDLVVFDFGPRTEQVLEGPPKTYQSGLQSGFGYDVYQNKLGLVRYVLDYRRGPRKDVLGDFASKLVDPNNNSVILFLSPSAVYRGRLNRFPATTTPLEKRKVLGFDCKGVETRYQDNNGFKHLRQAWASTQTTFLGPLLEMDYTYDPDSSLREITLGAVTQLQAVPSVDPSLFEIPRGVTVTDESK